MKLLLCGLALLLVVFGCAGRGYNAPATGQSSGIAVGDSEIAPQTSQPENDTLSTEPVVPPDNSSEAGGNSSVPAISGNVTGNMTSGNGLAINESDLVVSDTTNEDLISQEDVVGPP